MDSIADPFARLGVLIMIVQVVVFAWVAGCTLLLLLLTHYARRTMISMAKLLKIIEAANKP